MKIPDVRQAEESQSMSAMTDVVFLLLIFFIVTMSSYAEVTLLETKLPTSSGASATQPKLENPVRIDIPPPSNDLSIYIVNGSSFNGDNINILLRLQALYKHFLLKDAAYYFLLVFNYIIQRTDNITSFLFFSIPGTDFQNTTGFYQQFRMNTHGYSPIDLF